MMGLTRGPVTLVAAGCAGLLVWLATQIDDSSTGGYWAVYGLIAGAGLVLALSQVAGGWTKWGWPRLSLGVLLFAFVPVLVCVLWVAMAGQPGSSWLEEHVVAWSGDIGIDNLVNDLLEYLGVLAFGLGLVLGFTADTAPPAQEARGPVEEAERELATKEPVEAENDGRPLERVPSR